MVLAREMCLRLRCESNLRHSYMYVWASKCEWQPQVFVVWLAGSVARKQEWRERRPNYTSVVPFSFCLCYLSIFPFRLCWSKCLVGQSTVQAMTTLPERRLRHKWDTCCCMLSLRLDFAFFLVWRFSLGQHGSSANSVNHDGGCLALSNRHYSSSWKTFEIIF